MDYMCAVWDNCGKQNAQHHERLQNQAIFIFFFFFFGGGGGGVICMKTMNSQFTEAWFSPKSN